MSHRYFTRRITPATVFRALLSSALVGSFLMVNAAAAAEVNPISMPQIGDAQLRILSPTILELTLINTKEPDPARPTQWNFVDAHHTLALPAASELEVRAGTNKLSISTLGFKRRPLYAPVRSRDLRIENSLYLILSAPIANGQTVNVKNPSGNYLNPDTSFSAVVDPLRFNPALHVNQSGYLPAAPKKGMVGFYLGSLGEMPLSGGPFHLINASGQTNFSGSLVRRPDRGFISSPAPYQQVFQADFTALQTPGEYRLYVPGLGCSFSFYIHDGAAANFSRTLALGLYHQRCGGKNEMPFTRHEHDTCHSAPAEIPTMAHESVNLHLAMITADFLDTPRHTAPQLKDVSSSLYPFVKQGTVNVSLGHHDAGDYSKYTINSAHLIHHLVFAADNFPGAGKLDNLRLPESSDGKSDLLQEAKWEADFLVRMQDTDGGFYFLVYPRDRLYEDDVLPDEGDSQVAFPKNTSATAAAVAALAEIGSSPLFRQQFPLRSQTYIQKALLGWSFLTNALAKHGKDGAYQKITHYGNEFMHDDELAWAAAALFAATGNPSFQTQLMAWYIPTDPNTRRWTWWRLFEGYGGAARSFAFAARSGRLAPEKLNPGYLAAVEAEIIAAADDVARAAEQSAYGTSFPEATKRHATAGWYFSSERAFELAAAQQIKPQARYMDALLSNVNYEGGCNPMNLPYITGLGWKRWRDIVSQYAQNDDRVLPPSGLLLGNIQSGFSWLENYKQELGALCFPADSASEAPYPFYDRWGDSFNTTTEATILDHSRSLATYALLHGASAASNSASIELFGTITGLPRSAPAGEPLTARFEASGIDLSQATVVWEARDQEPYIGEIYNFAAQNPGEQWVEVEATLPDGNRIVGHAVFNATTSETVPSNSHRSAPLKLAPEIVALYHLDSNGNDASERNPALTIQGNAGFNSFNLGWMAARSGAALRFYDLGDKATVTLPTQTPQFSQAQEITIEAMVYVNAYKAWNRSTATLVGLHKSWNAHLQWLDDTYSGQHIRGGTQFDLFGTLLNSAMPLHQWHHLSMTIDRNRYSARVNGKLIGITTSTELANWSGYPATLEIGNFDGWIDEVVVRNARTSNLPQLPSMPADFGATAVSSSEVRLQWRDTSTNESGFRIFRSANNIDFGEIGAPTADSTNFVDAALKPAASYHYVIAAFNFAGESEMLSTNVTTLPPLSLPAPNLRAQGNGTERIDLSWSDESPNETRFQIERSRDGMFFVRIATVAANSVKYSDWTSEPNRTYHYRVRAWNSETTSRYSNVASARARSYYTGKLH